MTNNISARPGQDLHPIHLKHIIAKQIAESEWLQKHRIIYPDRHAVPPESLISPMLGKPSFPGIPDYLFGRDGNDHLPKRDYNYSSQFRVQAQDTAVEKFPDPAAVHQVIVEFLAEVPLAGISGALRVFQTNIENADITKINFFADSFVEIGLRASIWLVEEADDQAAQRLAELLGYNFASSGENSRGQAVHILWNDARLEQVGEAHIYISVANIYHIPDLRPALRVNFRDRITEDQFSVVVLHLKSMLGGQKVTSVIRHKQLTLLAGELGPDFKGLVGGDLNFPLNSSDFQDAESIYQAGFTLIEPDDGEATQILGARIDGFFVKGLTFQVEMYRVFAYFEKMGRALTDHASISIDLATCQPQTPGDRQCISFCTGLQ